MKISKIDGCEGKRIMFEQRSYKVNSWMELRVVMLAMVFMVGSVMHSNRSAAIEVLDLETKTFDLGKGVTLEMNRLPAGTFRMGSADGALSFLPGTADDALSLLLGRNKHYPSETPAHAVELSEFWIGKYEVTQEQYETIMGNNPSHNKKAKNPVEQVSWDDAMAFCKALSNITGTSFTLPTEAQWEYACRAGSQSRFYYGDSESILGEYAWISANSDRTHHPVGQKKSNAWGLYDMHGNVWELCRDYYDRTFYGTSAATKKNPENTKTVNLRVMRGGGWKGFNSHCRSARRSGYDPNSRSNGIGFRIVRTQP